MIIIQVVIKKEVLEKSLYFEWELFEKLKKLVRWQQTKGKKKDDDEKAGGFDLFSVTKQNIKYYFCSQVHELSN